MNWSIVLTFLGAIVWPLVAVIAVLVFRRPMIRLASEIAVRTRKVSFKGVSLELQPLPALAPSWDVSWPVATEDVRQLTSSELFDSYSSSLFEQLLHPREADYATVDLGRGQEWLTSRLYIFALVLGEVSHLRALVFLETVAGVRRRFLGVAAPADVRVSLARRYPWLEHAFALAYAARYSALSPDVAGQSTLPSSPYILEPSASGSVMQLVREFVSNIQRTTEPPQSEQNTYLSFQTASPGAPTVLTTLWERGEWIDGEKLEHVLGEHLQNSWFFDSPDLSRRARIDGILRRTSPFVALVDEDRRFAGLVDRSALLSRTLGEADESLNRPTT